MKQEVKKTFWQFVKFNIVGVLNTAVDFGVYFLLTKFAGMNYVLAQTISYTAGIANSYVWNTIWTFKQEKRRNTKEILLFILVNLVSYGVSVGILALCKDVFHVPYELVSKAAASFGSALVNFAGNKLFVFNKENPENAPAAPDKEDSGAGGGENQ